MARPVYCPLCHAVDVRPDAEVLDLAAAAVFRCRACRHLVLAPGASPGHPEAPPPGPPLGPDDLIEVHTLLDGEGWWAALTAGGSS